VSLRSELTPRSGVADGYRGDLRLERDVGGVVVLDATALRGCCHPMFALRMRLFLDWHAAAGHQVRFIMPTDPVTAQHLADMAVAIRLPSAVAIEGTTPSPVGGEINHVR
jgi:hypothetical protein